MDVSNGLNCIRIYSNLVKQVISFETSPLVDCMIYSTMGLNNVCSFSHLNMPGVCISDLRSVQFDVRDGDDEVSIISGIYINIQFTYSTNRFYYVCSYSVYLFSFILHYPTMLSNESIKRISISIIINQSINHTRTV